MLDNEHHEGNMALKFDIKNYLILLTGAFYTKSLKLLVLIQLFVVGLK